MANNNITSANAVLILSVPLFLPTPVQIQGFETDDVLDVEEITRIETRMGVDGFFVGGYIYAEKPIIYTLSPASPSCDWFDAWSDAEDAALIAAPAVGTITYTAIGKTYALANGFKTRGTPLPSAKKTLGPRKFRIVWGGILRSPVGLSG